MNKKILKILGTIFTVLGILLLGVGIFIAYVIKEMEFLTFLINGVADLIIGIIFWFFYNNKKNE